jgi:hypothetical protein
MELETANSIVTVGDGRGFVVAGPRESKLIITAAHCLPHLPPAHRARYAEEATYANLIGPIGEAPKIWTECLFADSVADLAILGPTDSQELGDESDAYNDFVEPIKPIAIADTKRKAAS